MFPIFEQLNMLAIDERFPESYFDTVICFGNTLVHLLNDDDISQFLKAAFKVLSSEGKLTIQILNYQHIIANQIKSLPLIDNKNIRFERNYEFEDDPGLISFNTKLIVKSTGQEIINSTKLYAIRKNELQQILEKTGFTSIEFFGGFNLEPLTDKNLPLVLSCQKP
jgi:ubiquinone/menaquinone biosynthesis C-methylase UbiE